MRHGVGPVYRRDRPSHKRGLIAHASRAFVLVGVTAALRVIGVLHTPTAYAAEITLPRAHPENASPSPARSGFGADTVKEGGRFGVRCDLDAGTIEMVVSGIGANPTRGHATIEVGRATDSTVMHHAATGPGLMTARIPRSSPLTTALIDSQTPIAIRLADGRSFSARGSRTVAAVAIACAHAHRSGNGTVPNARPTFFQPPETESQVSASACERRADGSIRCRAKADQHILKVVRARGLEARDPAAAARLYEEVISARPWTTYSAHVFEGQRGEVQSYGNEPDLSAVIEAESRLGTMLLLGAGVAADLDRGTTLLLNATQKRCGGARGKRHWLCDADTRVRAGH